MKLKINNLNNGIFQGDLDSLSFMVLIPLSMKLKNTDYGCKTTSKRMNYGHFKVICKKDDNLEGLGLISRVFANGSGDQGSISGRIIPKTQKMVLDAALLNTQHCKVRIKGKVEQSRERSSTLPYTSV